MRGKKKDDVRTAEQVGVESPTLAETSDHQPDRASAALPARPVHLYDPGCGKELDAWGVTRQFAFGQFVTLYARELVDGVERTVPLVVTPEGTLNRIVGPEDNRPATDKTATTVDPAEVVDAGGSSARDGQPPARTIAEALGGLPLDLALTAVHPLDLVTQSPPEEVILEDLAGIVEDKPLPTTAGELQPVLDKATKVALLEGHTVDAIAERHLGRGKTEQILVRLRPSIREVPLDEDAVDAVLATGVVTLPGTDQTLTLTRSARVDAALRSGSSVTMTVALGGGALRVYRLTSNPSPTSAPLAETFTIPDPSVFLRHPYLPSVDGTPLRVQLDAEMVRALRTERAVEFSLNGHRVWLRVAPGPRATDGSVRQPSDLVFTPRLRGDLAPRVADMVTPAVRLGLEPGRLSTPADHLSPAAAGPPDQPVRTGSAMSVAGGYDGGYVGLTPDPDGGGWNPILDWPAGRRVPEVHLPPEEYDDWASRAPQGNPGGTGAQTTPPTAGQERIPGPTKGLPVAVFLPWKQEWRFTGLSRGNLLTSIALAPLEERTIRLYSWERRSKALEQSSEAETEMQQDYTSTTRDTEDVFREMTSTQKFSTQVGADFEASYSPGVASIRVGADLDLSQEHGLHQVARSSTQHLTETVHRASARVRSRRITKIAESEETVRGEDVVRRIANPNECRTLTLDYYEQIAHYAVRTTFDRDRVRMVVMVDNPLRNTPFTNMTLRTNETALRQALLNPELGNGFAAARLLASYDNAWLEAKRVAEESKKVAELDRERATDPGSTQTAKPDNPYRKLVLQAAKDVRNAARAVQSGNIDHALQRIRDHVRPNADEVKKGQYWLWRTLAAAKVGAGATDALTALAGLAADPTIEDARRFQDAFAAGAAQELGRLASLPDNEKENLALSGAIRRYLAMEWDWHWWSSSCRDHGLYSPNDAGLVGALTRMSDALGKYDAKESEGTALLQQQAMVQQANDEQAAANWVDKLEMKYGLDVVADARERQDALLAHLNDHKDYYRYVLFQALPPGEQLKLLTGNAAQLRIGYFEPRVVAYSGDQLAIPLTPTGQNELTKFVDDLKQTIGTAADEAQAAADQMAPEDVILPTAGLVVETSLGACCACEPHRQRMHEVAERTAEALAVQAEAEATRRMQLLEQDPPNLAEFASPNGGAHLTVRLEGSDAQDVALGPRRTHPDGPVPTAATDGQG